MRDKKIPRVMDLRGTYKGGGGPDKTILNSAAQHDPKKVYVLVTYLRQPWDDEFQIAEQARALGINYIDVVDGRLLDVKCVHTLVELIREHRLTVLHAHDDKTLLYGWVLRLIHPRLRIMYTCHSHAVHTRADFERVSEYLLYKLRQKIQLSLMKRYLKPIIAVSADTKDRLVNYGLKEDEVAVLYNGIDTDLWKPDRGRPVLRRELLVGDRTLLVGMVARITPEKDLHTFFLVAEIVSRRLPHVRFVVVGDGYGNELDNAREEVVKRGLAEVVYFTGHRADLLDVYASFDLFLMTSITEGLPNTLLEAMALGVPSVCTSVGGVPELLKDGEGGVLCGAGAAGELADAVVRVLKDATFRRRCANLARARVERFFSFAERVAAMERYYDHFACGISCPEAE